MLLPARSVLALFRYLLSKPSSFLGTPRLLLTFDIVALVRYGPHFDFLQKLPLPSQTPQSLGPPECETASGEVLLRQA
jgi:hypothetical protein